jgi:hypothetical protein
VSWEFHINNLTQKDNNFSRGLLTKTVEIDLAVSPTENALEIGVVRKFRLCWAQQQAAM